ncbi:unnamed protein product [Taenia asiatica]|uniref:LOB domain-containing protein n=1 Tax=Taenia asiatica TaxID=60517 RepID=A0A0R3WH45_TAEAS|nr:unnamed protein product [Taenia asiatica]
MARGAMGKLVVEHCVRKVIKNGGDASAPQLSAKIEQTGWRACPQFEALLVGRSIGIASSVTSHPHSHLPKMANRSVLGNRNLLDSSSTNQCVNICCNERAILIKEILHRNVKEAYDLTAIAASN